MHVSGRQWIAGMMLANVVLMTAGTAIAQAQPPMKQSLWNSISGWLRRPKPPFGGRGGDCLINFDRAISQPVWHRRPMLIWQGNAGAIGVQKPETPQAFWQQPRSPVVGAGVQRLQYTGPQLEFGQPYEWAFFASPNSPNRQSWVPFEMVSGDRYRQIEQDLKQLETTLKQQNASPEAVVWQRADYFARQQLWADSLQELFSVLQPSAELQQLTQQIRAEACDAEQPTPPTVKPFAK
jgi:Domain of Unknown Function (DUF928)